MSQNRPAADISGVVEGLIQDGQDDLAAAVVRATSS
jgi:predicted FMN-binding regulatory protein PaiB